MEKILEELGFTSNEVKVYLTLLEKGPLNAGKITSFSGIHRRSIYDSLDRLIEKGVVGYIKLNNIKQYTPADPNQLIEILKRKSIDLNQIMPNLLESYNRTKTKKETLFFKGREGVKFIFEDQIKENKEVLIIGGSTKAYELLKYYLPHYERERKFKTKILFDNRQDIKIKNSEIKYVDYSLGPTAINIYGNKVALIVWSKNPYAILIDDEDVTHSYRQHFEVIWSVGKR